jgi:putative addiction module killer protein
MEVNIIKTKIELKEYKTTNGKTSFEDWLNSLDDTIKIEIRTVLARLEAGNKSNIKSVGEGVYERKVNYGPGYRIYFAHDSNEIIILLGGGTKKKQSADITNAKFLWKEYKLRKKKEAYHGINKRF